MNKFLITLFVFWVIWKVAKSAFEDLQKRMQDQQDPQRRQPAPPVGASPRRETPQSAEPFPGVQSEGWEGGETESGGELSEIERLFGEALELKRRVGGAAQQQQPQAQRPQKAYPRVAQQRTASRRVEPRRVARPREPAVAEEVRDRAKPAQARPKRRKPAVPRRRAAREGAVRAAPAIIGKLDKDDIRRSIVMAELLGPPKALRDIDAHVI